MAASLKLVQEGKDSMDRQKALEAALAQIDLPNMHFLPKPFSVAQIGEAVEGVLRGGGGG